MYGKVWSYKKSLFCMISMCFWGSLSTMYTRDIDIPRKWVTLKLKICAWCLDVSYNFGEKECSFCHKLSAKYVQVSLKRSKKKRKVRVKNLRFHADRANSICPWRSCDMTKSSRTAAKWTLWWDCLLSQIKLVFVQLNEITLLTFCQ